MNKKIIIILVLALLVAAFVTSRKNEKFDTVTDTELSWLDTPERASTTVEVGATGDYTYSEVTGVELPPAPQHRRPLSFPPYFNAEAKAITQKTVAGLQTSIDKNATDLKSWIELGNQYYLVRDFVGAELCWKYSLALNPNIYLALANLGTLYMSDIQNYKLSESYLRKAIVADSTQLSAYRSLYELYRYALKDDVKAKAALDSGIAANPGKATDLEYLRDHYNEQ